MLTAKDAEDILQVKYKDFINSPNVSYRIELSNDNQKANVYITTFRDNKPPFTSIYTFLARKRENGEEYWYISNDSND
ncbi:hypothetical protein [Aliarcobacter butzleri]|uniref:hypothetical protein n=1 Tax=Aliarcobacter butzleri TaxID=28197 RepID=UPI00062E6A43|nr:hypothetical protein [Aliarcobacter butzleri]KLD98815.1 hypothetical protein AF74_02105 [Aliarcobacter butzleri L349]